MRLFRVIYRAVGPSFASWVRDLRDPLLTSASDSESKSCGGIAKQFDSDLEFSLHRSQQQRGRKRELSEGELDVSKPETSSKAEEETRCDHDACKEWPWETKKTGSIRRDRKHPYSRYQQQAKSVLFPYYDLDDRASLQVRHVGLLQTL
jgi:hypothetical protein